MNLTPLKLVAAAFIPTTLLLIAGCTSPFNHEDRGGAIVETVTETATVQSIDAANRIVVLKREDGHLSSHKLGSQVINFDQIAVGDEVKATLSEATSIFLLKNGPPPSIGAGVMVAGAAKGEMPAGMALETLDVTAKVISADPSYRLLTLKYENGKEKTFKTPLGLSLEGVQPGDDVTIRVTNGMAIKVEKP
jgi:hypothetical protein